MNYRLQLCDIWAFVAFLLLVVGIRASGNDQAKIIVTTDGTTATVEAYGGDLGYPGPSSVEFFHDDLGVVLVTRVRLFDERETWVFVPWVSR